MGILGTTTGFLGAAKGLAEFDGVAEASADDSDEADEDDAAPEGRDGRVGKAGRTTADRVSVVVDAGTIVVEPEASAEEVESAHEDEESIDETEDREGTFGRVGKAGRVILGAEGMLLLDAEWEGAAGRCSRIVVRLGILDALVDEGRVKVDRLLGSTLTATPVVIRSIEFSLVLNQGLRREVIGQMKRCDLPPDTMRAPESEEGLPTVALDARLASEKQRQS